MPLLTHDELLDFFRVSVRYNFRRTMLVCFCPSLLVGTGLSLLRLAGAPFAIAAVLFTLGALLAIGLTYLVLRDRRALQDLMRRFKARDRLFDLMTENEQLAAQTKQAFGRNSVAGSSVVP